WTLLALRSHSSSSPARLVFLRTSTFNGGVLFNERPEPQPRFWDVSFTHSWPGRLDSRSPRIGLRRFLCRLKRQVPHPCRDREGIRHSTTTSHDTRIQRSSAGPAKRSKACSLRAADPATATAACLHPGSCKLPDAPTKAIGTRTGEEGLDFARVTPVHSPGPRRSAKPSVPPPHLPPP